MARCPNCEASVPIDAAECWNCKASFAVGSAWMPRPESREERNALALLSVRRNSQDQVQVREQDKRSTSTAQKQRKEAGYRVWFVFLVGIIYLAALTYAKVGGDDTILTAFFIPFLPALWWAVNPMLPDGLVGYWIAVIALGFGSTFSMTIVYIFFQLFVFR